MFIQKKTQVTQISFKSQLIVLNFSCRYLIYVCSGNKCIFCSFFLYLPSLIRIAYAESEVWILNIDEIWN